MNLSHFNGLMTQNEDFILGTEQNYRPKYRILIHNITERRIRGVSGPVYIHSVKYIRGLSTKH